MDVIFKYGTRAQYESIKANALENALYFLTDTGELYRGAVPIAQNHVYSVEPAEAETDSAAITRILNNATPVTGDFCFLTVGDVNKVYLYNGSAWKLITPETVPAESIVFEDGKTLEEALENASVTTDDITLEHNSEEALAIKDFGKKYYRYVPRVADEENPDEYIEAHYEVVEVSESNPWKAGLELRTTSESGSIVVGWFEPNTESLDGLTDSVTLLQSDVNDLQTVTGDLTTRVNDLDEILNGTEDVEGLVGRVENLETITSSVFSFKGAVENVEALEGMENPRPGDVYQIEDKEYVYVAPVEEGEEGSWIELGPNVDLSNYVTTDTFENAIESLQDAIDAIDIGVAGIKFNNVDITLDSNKIANIIVPDFNGTGSGLVPVFSNELEESDSAANYFLNGVGAWVKPVDSRVGDLTLNSVTYDTVTEYVNAAINTALTWSPII